MKDNKLENSSDFLILGAGIIGLTIARELKFRYPSSKITILEKENSLGSHGSGRNSGVLHSGLYYPHASLKAKVCSQGAKAMAEYCKDEGLPYLSIGKVIVPSTENEAHYIETLYERGRLNGVNVSIIDGQQLKEIEPEARNEFGKALYSPNTSIVDPLSVLNRLFEDLSKSGVNIELGSSFDSVDVEKSLLVSKGKIYKYGFLFNATGQHADLVAHKFGVGKRFISLPFKGAYFKLDPRSNIKINGLIYPVPDLKMPFLGVHTVNSVVGDTYFGPTSIPAFGRENYRGLEGFDLSEMLRINYWITHQYLTNTNGFRRLMHQEALKIFKAGFCQAAKRLVPNVRKENLISSRKVGIRAQLFDLDKKELVMDFLYRKAGNTMHVLNAISPAFTSSFEFAKLIIDESDIKG